MRILSLTLLLSSPYSINFVLIIFIIHYIINITYIFLIIIVSFIIDLFSLHKKQTIPHF